MKTVEACERPLYILYLYLYARGPLTFCTQKQQTTRGLVFPRGENKAIISRRALES